jgi:hypothetical protein
MKDKVEIDVIVCNSKVEIDKTINLFTENMYSTQYEITAIPIVGEISWIPKRINPEQDSFSM